MIQLGVERHRRLNRTKAPCGHTFQPCIANFVARTVGCRLIEDTGTKPLPRCKSFKEIQTFEEIYFAFLNDREEEIINQTACLPPCTFMKYKVLFSQTVSPDFGFYFKLAARDLTVVKEVG